jgi:hypothetical protein
MSTSLLYHAFGVMGRGIHYVHTRYEKGMIWSRVDQDPTALMCPECGSRAVTRREQSCAMEVFARRKPSHNG